MIFVGFIPMLLHTEGRPNGSSRAAGALGHESLSKQISAIQSIVTNDPDLMAILALIRDLALPDGWLMAGCLYQTVWNALTGRPRRTGIRDYDIGYFDASDLSYEAEDRIIQEV